MIIVGSTVVGIAIGAVVGFMCGRLWLSTGLLPLPGQIVFIKNLGEILVIGYTEDQKEVHYIPVPTLQGKEPHELTEEELDTRVVSTTTKEMLKHLQHYIHSRF